MWFFSAHSLASERERVGQRERERENPVDSLKHRKAFGVCFIIFYFFALPVRNEKKSGLIVILSSLYANQQVVFLIH